MTSYVRNDSDSSRRGSPGRKKAAADAIEMVPTRSTGGEDESRGPLKLDEANSVEKTGYMFSTRKKWQILTVVALCQTSMSMWLPCRFARAFELTRLRLQRGRLLERYRPSQRSLPSRKQPLHQRQGRNGLVFDPIWNWM
jgi:hypothetical protein